MPPKTRGGLENTPVARSRRRPTASARRGQERAVDESIPRALSRRRAPLPSQLESTTHEPITDPIPDDPPISDEDISESDIGVTTEDLPSRPALALPDNSLLGSISFHVASDIWCAKERPLLKCHAHSSTLTMWPLPTSPENSRWRQLIRDSGLEPLATCTYGFCNKVIVSTLVERWHPETNTFHLSVGEMGLTLDDVHCILGIPISGLPVHVETFDYPETLLEMFLGVSEDEAKKALGGGCSVSFNWLRTRFMKDVDSNDNDKVERAARAYLLYLLGSTLFVDKSGSKVPVVYLGVMSDLGAVKSYAWGAAALAHLYRQLGQASRSGVRQIGGYLTLLEAWAYEHIPMLRPARVLTYSDDLPWAMRWKPRRESATEVGQYREMLDDLQEEEVIFDPHVDRRPYNTYDDINFFTGCLCAFDVVEPYHPDRMMRQFGLRQFVPSAPILPASGQRGRTAKHYTVVYSFISTQWTSWTYHVEPHSTRERAKTPAECDDNYMSWYTNVSHLRVCNPLDRSIVPAGHDSGLRERHTAALDCIAKGLADEFRDAFHCRRVLVQVDAIFRGNDKADVASGSASGGMYTFGYSRRRRRSPSV